MKGQGPIFSAAGLLLLQATCCQPTNALKAWKMQEKYEEQSALIEGC